MKIDWLKFDLLSGSLGPAKSLKKFTDRGNSFSRSTFVSISPKESTPKIPIILKHDSTTTSEVKSVDNSDNKDKFNQLEKYQMSESDNKVNVMKTLHDNLHSKNDKVTNNYNDMVSAIFFYIDSHLRPNNISYFLSIAYTIDKFLMIVLYDCHK